MILLFSKSKTGFLHLKKQSKAYDKLRVLHTVYKLI